MNNQTAQIKCNCDFDTQKIKDGEIRFHRAWCALTFKDWVHCPKGHILPTNHSTCPCSTKD